MDDWALELCRTAKIKHSGRLAGEKTIATMLSRGEYKPLNPDLSKDIKAVTTLVFARQKQLSLKKMGILANDQGTFGEQPPFVVPEDFTKFIKVYPNILNPENLQRVAATDMVDYDDIAKAQGVERVCLTMETRQGILFSSLQQPVLDSSGVLVFEPISESMLPPHISITTIYCPQETVPAPKLGEACPPPSHLRPIAPPTKGAPLLREAWEGKRVASAAPLSESQTRTGTWLQYKAAAASSYAEPLDPEFVAAYTSFAPTRDDLGAAVPTSVKSTAWWSRRGQERLRRSLPHLFSDSKPTETAPNPPADVAPNGDAMEVDGEELVDEGASFEKAVAEYNPEEPPAHFAIDPRLLGDFEYNAKEVTEELKWLAFQQDQRLKTLAVTGAARPELGTAAVPGETEARTAKKLEQKLAKAISIVPPGLLAKTASTRFLQISEGEEVWKGTLPPVDGPKPPRPLMNGYGAHQQPAMPVKQQQVPQQYHPHNQTPVRVPVNVPAPPPPSQQYQMARYPPPQVQNPYGHPPRATPPPAQGIPYPGYHRAVAPPRPGVTPQPSPMPAPQARQVAPMVPNMHPHQAPQPAQPPLYHTHMYPVQVVQTPQRHQSPLQPHTPHYMQGIQPPPPRVIGPVNAPPQQTPVHQQQHHIQQTHHHHIPAQQPQAYHQHSIPQQPQVPQVPQYHHHHSVIRNPYPNEAPVPQMGGVYQPIQPQVAVPNMHQQPPRLQTPVNPQPAMGIPPPQGLATIGYGAPVPQGTPTPAARYVRK